MTGTKIAVRQSRLAGTSEEEKVSRKAGPPAYVRLVPRRFGKVVHLPSERRCPQHGRELLRISDRVAQKIVTDLVFTKSGCRKVITRYVGYKSYCLRTGKRYLPIGFEELATTSFGHSLKAWIIYQRVVFRLPYGAIIRSMSELFQERILDATIARCVCDFAVYYE